MDRYDDDGESENLSQNRYVHRHYSQTKNGNGNGNGKNLNTIVWAIASILSAGLVAFLWLKVIDHGERLVKLETIYTIERAIGDRNR